ncbi:(2Fe-2S)-binding protein [Streptomyces sp. NPDC093085]|uniref:(2Fe-2S)-binding protein n=1 Tax=Streptomyces sp. NPDC093085 TaxID=3155068 RepID=UPI003445B518
MSSPPASSPSVPSPFAFTFDGQDVPAEPGQSVAAALIASGRRSWRTTRVEGRPRGVFCGIGVCFDCLVTINRRPNHRACLAQARPGDTVTTQEGAGHDDLAC